jgi:hypothetical protein
MIIKRATAEHIVVQGREDALRALIIAETTEQGLNWGMDYRDVSNAAELAGLDRHGLTIVTAPEPDKTPIEQPANELIPVQDRIEPVRTVARIGDTVQIAFPDVQEFSKPRMVTSLSADSKTAFVELGDPRGYPIEWLAIVDGSGTGRYGGHDNWTEHGDGTDYPTDGASYGVGSNGEQLKPFVPYQESEPVAADPFIGESNQQTFPDSNATEIEADHAA